MSGVLPRTSLVDVEPHDVEDIIDRLHIGTLKREQLRARKSILVNEKDGPITHKEIEDLYRSETYSVTSEESYDSKKVKRKTSGASSSSSGERTPKTSDRSAKEKVKKDKLRTKAESNPEPKASRSIEVQTTFGKGQGSGYARLQDVFDAEEGMASHKAEGKSSSKLSKIFSKKKGSSSSDDVNGNQPEGWIELPQVFIVKYMGKRSAKGYSGVKFTSPPVEEVLEIVNHLPKENDLPLVKLEVSTEGLSMIPHKRNKVKTFEPVQIPIQYISYGTQDQNYPRIFSFIMVREMSARSKKLDCHVYAADSSKNARKMAGCLAFAFQLYSEMMSGKPSNYRTDIRPDPLHEHEDAKSSYDV